MKLSTALFLVTAFLLIIIGVYYIALPVKPLFAFVAEQSFDSPSNVKLIMYHVRTLQKIVGVSLLAVGLLIIYGGFKAWQDRLAWVIMLFIVFIYTIPIALTIFSAGTLKLLALLPAIPHLAGLAVAGTREKEWG
jgi:hypothetical protein